MSRFFSIALMLIFIFGVQFAGTFILDLMNYEWLQTPYIILIMLVLIVVPFLLVRRGKVSESPIRDIPTKLAEHHEELLSLGFELTNFAVIQNFFQSQSQWFYLNATERVYAYMNEGGSVWFSSYFEKNFDVTTRFRHGETIESKQYVAHVVKTSISQTFDYHLHHREQYGLQYGVLLLFRDLDHHMEWDNEQEVEKAYKRHLLVSIFKQLGRFALGLVILFLMGFPLGFLAAAVFMILLPSYGQGGFMVWWFAYFAIGFFISLFWAMWPSIYPKTVEDRKSKKPDIQIGINSNAKNNPRIG